MGSGCISKEWYYGRVASSRRERRSLYIMSGLAGQVTSERCLTARVAGARCNTGSHLSDSVWADMLEQTRQEEALATFQRLERQIVTDKSNLLKMRQRHPGKSKRTRSDHRIKDSPHTTIWKGSGVVVPLQELLDIGKMDGMLNGCVINELLQWILAGKSGETGLSPHQREGVVMWSTREWSTLSAGGRNEDRGPDN
jgi:hypothetical protein